MKYFFIGALVLLIGTILTQVAFLILKATDFVSWTWAQTFLPLMIGVGVYICALLVLWIKVGSAVSNNIFKS